MRSLWLNMLFLAVCDNSFKLINPVYFVSIMFLSHNCLFSLEKQEQCRFCLHAFWEHARCCKCTASSPWKMVCWEDDHCNIHGNHSISYNTSYFICRCNLCCKQILLTCRFPRPTRPSFLTAHRIRSVWFWVIKFTISSVNSGFVLLHCCLD